MYQIEITAQAQTDAYEAYAWMAETIFPAPAFAEKWYQELFKQIKTLTRHPSAARSPRNPASSPRKSDLVYGKCGHKHNYRILFAIREEIVTVLYVYHSSWKELEP